MKILINKFSSIYYLVLIMLLSGSLNSSYYSLLLPHDTFRLIKHINDYWKHLKEYAYQIKKISLDPKLHSIKDIEKK